MKIYVAGHRGLVGSAIVRAIEAGGEHTWIGQTRQELDLLNRQAVFEYVAREKPDWVVIAAAKVGGIHANSTYPVQFLSENLQIQTNVLDACHNSNIERVIFLGSSCIYPKFCSQPIKEDYLLTGALEPTNEPYAIAKIAGLKLVEAYSKQFGRSWISLMPTNLYGPGDNFDSLNSHVLPSLMRRFHEAKTQGFSKVAIWGDGTPLREFLHADDLADAVLFAASNYFGDSPINVGSGEEVSISGLAQTLAQVIGFEGEIEFDHTKPNGTPRKLLDSSVIRGLGWNPKISLLQGLDGTYRWFKDTSGLAFPT